MFQEAILEQTENILLTEMEKAAADAVKKSLLSLSPAKKQSSEKEENPEGKEEVLLNINVDWNQVASLANELLVAAPSGFKSQNNAV